jgi:hypothetical protein
MPVAAQKLLLLLKICAVTLTCRIYNSTNSIGVVDRLTMGKRCTQHHALSGCHSIAVL